jgi:hypothetical protein
LVIVLVLILITTGCTHLSGFLKEREMAAHTGVAAQTEINARKEPQAYQGKISDRFPAINICAFDILKRFTKSPLKGKRVTEIVDI